MVKLGWLLGCGKVRFRSFDACNRFFQSIVLPSEIVDLDAQDRRKASTDITAAEKRY